MHSTPIFVLLAVVLTSLSLATSGATSAPQAFLTINPTALKAKKSKLEFRQVEVGWRGLPKNSDGVVVALYDRDPGDQTNSTPILKLRPKEHPGNFAITEFQVPYVNSSQIKYKSHCVFDYWVRVEESAGGKPLSQTRCLRSEPRWMSDHKENIKGLELGELMLTASHDAAAYKEYDGHQSVIDRAVWAQEENLQQQLQWGVRFLDLRVGYFPNSDERFWFVHGMGQTHHPVSEGLRDVAQFLANSTDVVVLDTHTFSKSWTAAAHAEYQQLLEKHLGKWWVKPEGKEPWKLTLEEVWGMDSLPKDEGRVISIYQSGYGNSSLFFPNIVERWGNKDKREKLRKYLDDATRDARKKPEAYRPWRPDCQLTPDFLDIVFKGYSLRQLADNVNRYVTEWWRSDYADVTAGAFTLHDFVLGTDMVRVAIDANLDNARRKKRVQTVLDGIFGEEIKDIVL